MVSVTCFQVSIERFLIYPGFSATGALPLSDRNKFKEGKNAVESHWKN